MGRYEISALPRSSGQRIRRWNFKEVWQVSGSAVIDESFHNQFEWAPFTNGVAAKRGTSRPRHRWHLLAKSKICHIPLTILKLPWTSCSHSIMSKKMGRVALRSSVSGTRVTSRKEPTMLGTKCILFGPGNSKGDRIKSRIIREIGCGHFLVDLEYVS